MQNPVFYMGKRFEPTLYQREYMERKSWKDASHYYSLEKYKWKLQWNTISHPPDCKYVFTIPSAVKEKRKKRKRKEKRNFSWPIDRSINLNSFFSRQFGIYLVGLKTHIPSWPSNSTPRLRKSWTCAQIK